MTIIKPDEIVVAVFHMIPLSIPEFVLVVMFEYY